jgi:hypothetical protein
MISENNADISQHDSELTRRREGSGRQEEMRGRGIEMWKGKRKSRCKWL